MSKVRHLTTDADVESLAACLNSRERRRPVAVVTTPSRRPRPYIDAVRIATELSELVDVYLLETGTSTRTFANNMAPRTDVYGGAGRIYPVDLAWVDEPHRSPLRFAYRADEGERATSQLIVDGLEMAADAGLMPAPCDASDAVKATQAHQDWELIHDDDPSWSDGPDDPPCPTTPTPLLLDPTRRPHALQNGVPHPPAGSDHPDPAESGRKAITVMSDTIAALKAEVDARMRETAELRGQVNGLTRERNRLRGLWEKGNRTIEHQKHQIEQLNDRISKASPAPSASPRRTPDFADRQRGFRHAVETAWATRIPVAEQPTRPLASYRIGPDFLDSVDALEGVSEDKIIAVVVEVVTGVAASLNGRGIHPLRTGDSGSTPVRKREDGAVAWRVALQSNSPGARRLHFWRLPDGRVELSRVVLHDDTDS